MSVSGRQALAEDKAPLPAPDIRPEMVFTDSFYRLTENEKLDYLDRYEAVFDETTPHITRYAFLTTRLDVLAHVGHFLEGAKIADKEILNVEKLDIHYEHKLDLYGDFINVYNSTSQFENVFFILDKMREIERDVKSDRASYLVETAYSEVLAGAGEYKRSAEVLEGIYKTYLSTYFVENDGAHVVTIGNIVFSSLQAKDTEKALFYLSKIESHFSEKFKDDTDDPTYKRVMLHVQSNKTHAYLLEGRINEAKILAEDLLTKALAAENERITAWARAMLGVICLRQSSPDMAVMFFEPMHEWVKKTGEGELILSFYREYAEAFETTGQHDTAFDVLMIYHEERDKVTKTHMSARVALLEIDVAKEKAAQKILLLETENAIQREHAKWDGRVKNLLILAVFLLLACAFGLIGFIHHLRKSRARLIKSEKRATIASEAKSEFLANMSHEIRTPMNGVLGMAQVLEMSDLDNKQKYYIDILKSSGESLMVLINDILDFSKLEVGKVELNLEPDNLEQSLEYVIALLKPKATEKNIALNYKFDPKLPKIYDMDVNRLRQVVTNLVGNAIKFTASGQVDLNVTGKVDGEKALLNIEVRDSGIGIDEDKLDLIFEKFTQAEGSTTRTYGGSGLGLAISRKLVTVMGGEITVTSKLGEGSTFTISLPLGISLERVSQKQTAKNISNLERIQVVETLPTVKQSQPQDDVSVTTRKVTEPQSHKERVIEILIAEDDETNMTVIKSLLSHPRIKLTFAKNGEKVIEAFNRDRFDLIFMDVAMPVMDGVTATKLIRLKETQLGLKPTPIIGLSAHVMADQKQKFFAAGMDGFLPKPVEKNQLFAVVQSQLKSKRAAAA